MKTIKKAQNGVKQKPVAKSPVKKSPVKKGPRRTTSGMWVDEDKFQPPFPVTYDDSIPKVKPKVKKVKPKAKNGTSLGMKSVKAGFDKNPGVTRADIIVAAKRKAQNGKKIDSLAAADLKKMKESRKLKPKQRLDSLIKSSTKKTGNKVKNKLGLKSGGSVKKCKYGCK